MFGKDKKMEKPFGTSLGGLSEGLGDFGAKSGDSSPIGSGLRDTFGSMDSLGPGNIGQSLDIGGSPRSKGADDNPFGGTVGGLANTIDSMTSKKKY